MSGTSPVTNTYALPPSPPPSSPPTYGKIVVAVGIGLAVTAAAIQPMNPQVAFYLLAVSSGVNAFAAYLGWSK